MQTTNYSLINPSTWKLGSVVTTPKGLKKIEIQTEQGTKPIFQFWKAGDPKLRAPYGVSEPYGSNNAEGGAPAPPPPPPVNGKAAPGAALRGMPLDLTFPAHLAFAQAVDMAVTSLIYNNQGRILGIEKPDEQTPLGVLRRQFTSFCKPSTKPAYAATTRTKVNIGASELGTRVTRIVGGRQVPGTVADITKGCNVIPIIELSSIWLAANGGMGISGQILQVLITDAGSMAPMAFEGLDMLVDESSAPPHVSRVDEEEDDLSSSQPMDLV